jgi:hypothetical protein
MAKRPPKPNPEQATGQTKPEATPLAGAAATTGAAVVAPVTQPTTELAAAGTVGQATAGTDTGATSLPAVVNELVLPETIIVTGPKKGRWRAKRFFTEEPVTINLTDLSNDDLALLASDPELTVTTVDAPY